jgi:hypothetical protein
MELLNEMILETKQQIDQAEADRQKARADIDGYEQLSREVAKDYNKILTWADLFDNCTMEAKKMIVAQLIKQVRVGKDYHMEIDLHISFEKFSSLTESDLPFAQKEKMLA